MGWYASELEGDGGEGLEDIADLRTRRSVSKRRRSPSNDVWAACELLGLNRDGDTMSGDAYR
jgi:hypothetical protein